MQSLAQRRQLSRNQNIQSREENQNDMTANSMVSQSTGKKQRGRKQTETQKYIQDSEKKIKEWKDELKNNKKLKREEKQKLRNQISAQQSRLKKKIEMQHFLDQIQYFKDQFLELAKVLNTEMDPTTKDNVLDKIYKMMPDTTDFDEIPDIQ